MTGKAFSKLTRQELLRLLLAQGQEQKRLEDQMSEMTLQKRELEQSYERLKKRLDDKDEQIEHLKGRLDNKDKKIKELESGLKNGGSIEQSIFSAKPQEDCPEPEPADRKKETQNHETKLVQNKTESVSENGSDWDFDAGTDWNKKESASENEFDWDFI